MFGVMVGIDIPEGSAAYREIVFAPHPDRRMGFARASIETDLGKLSGGWSYTADGDVRYELSIPDGVRARVRLHGREEFVVGSGNHTFIV